MSKLEAECGSLTTKLEKKARSFIDDPSRKNVHDLRTAVRRVQAVLDLFPKNLRKKGKIQQYKDACKALFKSTSQIRDIDTIANKLKVNLAIPDVRKALVELELERQGLVSIAADEAKNFLDLEVPRLKKGDLTLSKVRKRKEKLAERLETRISRALPNVIADSRKLAELHELRKDCKKLRYLLEIFPVRKGSKVLDVAREWQDTLGDVRDSDITERFIVEKNLQNSISTFLVDLQMSRDKTFSSFVHRSKTVSVFANHSSVGSIVTRPPA